MSKKNGKEVRIDLQVGPRIGGVNTKSLVECSFAGKKFRDELNVNKAEHRQKLVKEIAKRFGIPIGDLDFLDDQLLQKADAADEIAEAARRAPQDAEDESEEETAEQISARILASTPQEVIETANRFLKNPKIMSELAEDIENLGVVGEQTLAKAAYLVATSRKLSEPLGAIIQAASSSGKSHVKDKVIGLVPEEDLVNATDMTPQSLYYLPQGSLKHKLVVVAERKHVDLKRDPAAGNATLGIREMLSAGRLSKMVTLSGDDGLRTVMITQEGPIGYLETSTAEEIFEEDSTRLMSLVADESADQTGRVIAYLGRRAAHKTMGNKQQDAIRQKHQTAQRLLQSCEVIIPFAEQLTIPTAKVSARRAYGQLLTMIRTVALLRQFQRKKNSQGCIVASIEDYRTAYNLMVPILRRVLAPMSEGARKLLETIRTNVRETRQIQFDRADVVKWTGLSRTAVRQRLDVLCEAGHIDQLTTSGKGTKSIYKVEADKSERISLSGLVSPDVLAQKLVGKRERHLAATQKV